MDTKGEKIDIVDKRKKDEQDESLGMMIFNEGNRCVKNRLGEKK